MFDLNSDQVPMLDDSQDDTPELTYNDLCGVYRQHVCQIVAGQDTDRECLAEVMDAIGVPAEQLEADVELVRNDIRDSHRQGSESQFDSGDSRLKLIFAKARASLV